MLHIYILNVSHSLEKVSSNYFKFNCLHVLLRLYACHTDN